MADFLSFPDFDLDNYLAKLTPETNALWGLMTPQHMLEHVALVFRISRGEHGVPVVTPTEKIERVRELFLFSSTPFKQNFKSPIIPEGLQGLEFESLEKASQNLKNEIQLFLDYYHKNPDTKNNHPVFGSLNFDDWKFFHGKHFTHHFNQFGLLS